MIIDMLGDERGNERSQRLAREGLKDSLDTLATLASDYLKKRDARLADKKFEPYVGITKTVVIMGYTLPGGPSKWLKYLRK